MRTSTWTTAAAVCAVSAGVFAVSAGCGDSAKQMAGNLGSTVAEGWNRFGTEPGQQQAAAATDPNAPAPTQMQPPPDPTQFRSMDTATLDQRLAQVLQPQQQSQQASAQQAAAQQTNTGRGAVQTLGQDRYRAACNEFVALAAEQQKTDVWCWAACVQMVNKYNGVETTQADIASRIHGQAADANGNLDPERVKRAGTTEIMLALNPEFQSNVTKEAVDGITAAIESHGKVNLSYDAKSTAMALFRERAYSDNDMIADVARGMPVVVGLKDKTGNTGHAYVVHATTYKATKGVLPGSYTYALESVEAVDPWDGKAVSIPAGEFRERCGFKISQARARRGARAAPQCGAGAMICLSVRRRRRSVDVR